MIDKETENYCQGFGDCKSEMLQSIEQCLKMLHEEIQYSLDYNKKGGDWPQTTPEQLAGLRTRAETFKQFRTMVKSMKPRT